MVARLQNGYMVWYDDDDDDGLMRKVCALPAYIFYKMSKWLIICRTLINSGSYGDSRQSGGCVWELEYISIYV